MNKILHPEVCMMKVLKDYLGEGVEIPVTSGPSSDTHPFEAPVIVESQRMVAHQTPEGRLVITRD